MSVDDKNDIETQGNAKGDNGGLQQSPLADIKQQSHTGNLLILTFKLFQPDRAGIFLSIVLGIIQTKKTPVEFFIQCYISIFQAYRRWVSQNGNEPSLPGLKYNHNQMFFISFAQVNRNEILNNVLCCLIKTILFKKKI